MMPTDHRELVLRARDGDHAAFAALVDASIDRWYGAARLIVRDDQCAEDAVQDALVVPRAPRRTTGRGRCGGAAGNRRVTCTNCGTREPVWPQVL